MRKSLYFFVLVLLASGTFYSCEPGNDNAKTDYTVPKDIVAKIESLGFDVTDKVPTRFEHGYLVEGDIYLTDEDLNHMGPHRSLPVSEEQYSTNNLVTGTPRNITVYISSSSFSAAYISAVDVAISRYNAENLSLTFTRVTSSAGATIVFSRLAKSDERRGVLGSSGFPTASGNPYGQIKMSGILQSTYGLSVNGIATIIAHEMGHCIGFRHTDYFNRAISCGGSTSNEGDGGVGANHIPGTPTGATLAGKSWMLACTDGSDRPFNNDDKTALQYLY
jgi:hypothetical protein